MNIRPHHLLCVQNYIGYGYNEKFRLHMDEMTKKLAKDPEVVIHEGCDDICTACPYNKDGTCTSLDKVDRMDNKVLSACNLKYGNKRKWSELTSLAKANVFETNKFYEICHDCQWYDICQKRLGHASENGHYVSRITKRRYYHEKTISQDG